MRCSSWTGIIRPLHSLHAAQKNKDKYARTEYESNQKLQSLYHVMSAQQALTSWRKIFLGTLIVLQVENYSIFKEPKCTLLHSQKTADEPHLESDKFNSYSESVRPFLLLSSHKHLGLKWFLGLRFSRYILYTFHNSAYNTHIVVFDLTSIFTLAVE
jgi:hypothetical protein